MHKPLSLVCLMTCALVVTSCATASSARPSVLPPRLPPVPSPVMQPPPLSFLTTMCSFLFDSLGMPKACASNSSPAKQ